MHLTAKVIRISHAKYSRLRKFHYFGHMCTYKIYTCMGKPYLTCVGHVCGLPLLPRMVNPPVAHSLYIQSAFSPNYSYS